MARSSVLFVANNEHGLADERVERVAHHHLKRQTPGIMTSLRGKAVRAWEAIDTRTRSIRRGSGHGTSERWFVVIGGDPLRARVAASTPLSGGGHSGSRTG
jgi:hypothetical protein